MEKQLCSGQIDSELRRMWEFYEEMNEIVYVADADRHELVYMNRRAREIFGVESIESIDGKKCYEILSGSSTPCVACNCSKCKPGFFMEEVRYNPVVKKKLSLKDTIIEQDGRRFLMRLAFDLGAWEQQNAGYEANEAMVNEALRISLAQHTPYKSIAALLEYLGQSLGSERVYIFEETERNTFDNTYEWCAKGVISQKENLQDVPFEVVSLWYREFTKGGNIIIKDVEKIRETDRTVYEYLLPQKIRSLVVCPLVSEGRIIGFYGVDNPPKKFLEHITTLLQILGHFIVSLLDRRDYVRRLEELCFQDQLTGIGNRHAVHDYVPRLDQHKSIGIVYCDVMGLKAANDAKGHLEGDKLLIRASECLSKVFSEYKLFRVGGDEFLALCSGMEEAELNRRVELLKREMRLQNAPMAIGCVWRANIDESVDRLLTMADDRMYENKRVLYATEFKAMARS